MRKTRWQIARLQTARWLGAALLVSLVAAPAPARGDWQIGRGPEVFRPDAQLLTTRIGGWLDASYEDNDLSTSTRSLNLNHLNVFADTRYGSAWQAFLEVEFENESDLTGYEPEREYEVEQAYGRFRYSEALELRIGKFNTPFGYWTPIHWAILMDTIRPPLHEASRLTPEQETGAVLQGRWFPKLQAAPDVELSYSLFAGYGSGSSVLESSETDGWSGGADLRMTLRTDHFVGASLLRQDREFEREPDRGETSLVLYAQATPLAPLLLRGECVRQERDRRRVPGSTTNVDITYLKARWRLSPEVYLNYRFNWGDDDLLLDPGAERRAHTFTLGYQPRPWLRIKLEYADHRFDDSNRRGFRYWGVSFGSLF